jgi:hypothetical protein
MIVTEQKIPIQDSDNLVCSVWQYAESHSHISIRIGPHLKPLYWLGFGDIGYMSLRPSWHGANFYIAVDAQYRDLMARLYGELDELSLSRSKLYVVRPVFPQIEFYIIAGRYSLRKVTASDKILKE